MKTAFKVDNVSDYHVHFVKVMEVLTSRALWMIPYELRVPNKISI